jgi:O-antigen/teichoic acid export membrane protein
MGGRALLTLLFGQRFGAAQEVFVILCVGIPWYTMALPVGYGFIAERNNRPFVTAAVLAGIVNIVLIFTLIPPAGATGAAVATSASLMTAAAAWITFSRRGHRFALAATALPALGTLGAIMAILVPASSLAIGLGTVVAAAAATTSTIRREIRRLGR